MQQSLVFALLLFVASLTVTYYGTQRMIKLEKSQSSPSITIQSVYPDSNLKAGTKIYIRGDACGLNWTKGLLMTKIAQNTFSIDLQCNVLLLNYKVLQNDNNWMVGVNAQADTSINNNFVVYPFFNYASGTLQIIKNVKSTYLNNSRDVIVYWPPSYAENTLKVYSNILIMHDGQNLFDPKTAFLGNSWLCQNTLDSLINSGGMQEVVVVGPYNTADRINEYTYSYDPSEEAGGKGDLYLDFLQHELVPLIQKQFQTRVTQNLQKGVGILGSSLGGLISCYAGWTRSDYFTKAGCMSSSFWWNDEDFLGTVMGSTIPFKSVAIYLDSGDSGPSQDDVDQTNRVKNRMISNYGFKIGSNLDYYLDKGGQHSETYWGKRFDIPMAFLYGNQ